MSSTTQQTVGVELEFIIFYTTSDQPIPDKDSARYGPVYEIPLPIPIPSGFDWGVEDVSTALEAPLIRQRVADVITAAGFKAKAQTQAKMDGDTFDAWSVVPDVSLKLPLHIGQAYAPLKAVGVELNSPAFDAGPAAFEEISAVVKAINAAFRTIVPPCCGFHVHVGRGRAPLELRPVQRTVSLLWLAENLLTTLHPSCRQGNKYCQHLGFASNLVGNMEEEEVQNAYEGKETEKTEESDGGEGTKHAALSWDRVDKNRQKPTYFRRMYRLGVTDTTPSRSFAEDFGLQLRDHEEWFPSKLERIAIARKVLGTSDLNEMANIVSRGVRGAYNFMNLLAEKDKGKPTIEFRQAAGSLDEDWIIVWAKICLALCGPAVVESSDDALFQLLYDCAESEDNNAQKYNVFDLLHDIGLDDEDIKIVQDRLAIARHEREPVLPFHRPDDCPNGILDENIGTNWNQPLVWDDWVSEPWDEDEWNRSGGKDKWEQQPVKQHDGWASPPPDKDGCDQSGLEDGIRHLSLEQFGESQEPSESNINSERAAENDGEWDRYVERQRNSELLTPMTSYTENDSSWDFLEDWVRFDTRVCRKGSW
ncbi:putative amidoligase enzyme-domain-containing protein [Xylaria sp. FL1042]|nr:putative amidoligase enzyme-domain-containing protein [Xylaria sp. FL1042]